MIWTNEQSGCYHRVMGDAPAFLPAPHQQRWHRLRLARMLYEGRHRPFFLDEGRTQFHYPPMRVNGNRVQLYLTLNLLRLVSVKTADLMFGAKAKLDAPTVQQTERLDELARRSRIHARFHAAAIEASWAGGAFLEACLYRAEAYLDTVPPDDLFPVGLRSPDDQYEQYVRYATADIGTESAPLPILLETWFQPGAIIRRLYQIEPDGVRARELDLRYWPHWPGDVPPHEQRTGIRQNTITFLPNEAAGRLEVSDYDGLIELQDAVNAKFAQVARVLAKHADPRLALHASAAGPDGKVRTSQDVYYYHSDKELPQYITWNAELGSAMADREAAINAFCIGAEASQVLLGIQRGAAPNAARKLRLEATNWLAKAARKAANIEPAIARAIETAQRLDQTSTLCRTYPVDPVGVEMRDGLPIDELDEARVIATLRSAQVMSIEDAVERRKEDPDAAYTELQRLAAERGAAHT